MSIQCGNCGKTISAERAGRHSQTCKVQVAARVAEDRKARPAQYTPLPATSYRTGAGTVVASNDPIIVAAVEAAVDDLLSAPTQGMLFGEDWTR